MASILEALAIADQHYQAGRLQEAARIYLEVQAADPQNSAAPNGVGIIAAQMGKHDLAEGYFRQALALNCHEPTYHNNLGDSLKAQGKIDESLNSFQRALTLRPDYFEAHNNLGTALHLSGKFDEAAVAYRQALALRPDYVPVWYNLGMAFQAQGKLEDAISTYRQALSLDSAYADAASNLAMALHAHGQLEEAAATFETVLSLKPGHIAARANRSLLMLLQGDFARGWAEYDYRLQATPTLDRGFAQPKWDGSPLNRPTILLHGEQGLGDTIQFVRYAMHIKNQNPAATVVVECQPPLKKLLESCGGVDQLITQGSELPPFDVHCSLVSLPGVFQTILATIPAEIPYLTANPTLVEYWRETLRGLSGLRIGINWQGRAGQGQYRKRDIPIEHFAALAQVPGINLVRLQKNDPGSAPLGQYLPIFDPGPDFDTAHGSFMDTAAVMMSLDLVITSDTAIPHLAGALGLPVWLALPYVPDWRWLLDRADSPWYPTMRLFRQRSPGDWFGVFDEIQLALYQLIHRSNN
jgi:Flp pilus assembly protein TadD